MVTHLLEADLIKSPGTRPIRALKPAAGTFLLVAASYNHCYPVVTSQGRTSCLENAPLHTCMHHPFLFSYKATVEQSLIRGPGVERVDGSVGKVFAVQNEHPNLRPQLPCKKSNMAVCDVILVLGRQRPEGSWS